MKCLDCYIRYYISYKTSEYQKNHYIEHQNWKIKCQIVRIDFDQKLCCWIPNKSLNKNVELNITVILSIIFDTTSQNSEKKICFKNRCPS